MPPETTTLPIRVRTTPELLVLDAAEPVYGALHVTAGEGVQRSIPVRCNQITITVPTGTGDKAFSRHLEDITTTITPVYGKDQGRQWGIIKNTTDPKQTVFICTPESPATFDGTWTVTFTLDAIPINPENKSEATIEISTATATDATRDYTPHQIHVDTPIVDTQQQQTQQKVGLLDEHAALQARHGGLVPPFTVYVKDKSSNWLAGALIVLTITDGTASGSFSGESTTIIRKSGNGGQAGKVNIDDLTAGSSPGKFFLTAEAPGSGAAPVIITVDVT
ncbi:hypothetical protein ACIP5Y_07015 [Nocardia sp. NPDC088792]|uniref:hypothetical protein n=1 Tax=Nocardia sp. NPDC088792 TaxID=3364332 RepID=UPI0037F35192